MTNKKILLVDDDKVVQMTLKRILSGNYDIVQAYNGNDGLRMVFAEKPDLILLDINMPEKDGREMLEELRENPATEKLPVIMLSGEGEVMDKILGFELGADDYITKPFETEQLLERIEKVFTKKNL